MKSIDQMTRTAARNVRAVFTDIDDTLTTDGKLTSPAYEALWSLSEAGVEVVPVTGRPAGWCDLIARQWPVAGVVGENGALAFFEVEGRLTRLYHPAVAGGEARGRLREIEEAVLEQVPGSRVSKDQFARLFDLAIDFCEEPPDLGLAGAEKIRSIFERMGAVAKVSSIHVNGWFGEYDKLSMVEYFCAERWGLSLAAHREEFLFCGDSPNDEPMFEYFPLSCGVANIRDFESSLKATPTFVSASRGGAGFCELASRLLELRSA